MTHSRVYHKATLASVHQLRCSIDWTALLKVFIIPPADSAGYESVKPASHYCQRKPWESSYDPKYAQKGTFEVTKAPSTDTLPAKKWAIPREAENKTASGRRAHRKEILDWLREQKIKFQVCLIEINNKEQEVFLFKKEKTALLFKLTWG